MSYFPNTVYKDTDKNLKNWTKISVSCRVGIKRSYEKIPHLTEVLLSAVLSILSLKWDLVLYSACLYKPHIVIFNRISALKSLQRHADFTQVHEFFDIRSHEGSCEQSLIFMIFLFLLRLMQQIFNPTMFFTKVTEGLLVKLKILNYSCMN